MPFQPDKPTGRFQPDYPGPKTVSPRELPQEEPLERVGLLESAIPAVKAYGATVGALGALSRFGTPRVAQIAGGLMPQTGAQMARQAAGAGVAGIGGEMAAREAPEKYKGLARIAGELGTAGALGGLGYGAQKLGAMGRGPTPSIPRERIESARYMQEIGAPAAPEQVKMGAEAGATIRRLTQQQGVANEQYNKVLGLEPKKEFGRTEFNRAKANANADYERLLKDREVTFDDSFFGNLEQMLAKQQRLADTGITFGQSRAILGALERISGIPQRFKDAIGALPRIGEEEVTAKQSQRALSLLNEMLPALREQGAIKMSAKEYNEIRSILGDAAMRQSSPRNARLLRQMQGEFDRMADQSMPEIAQDLGALRQRYEALKTLEEAQLQSGVEMGMIPPEAVGRAIRRRMEEGSIYAQTNPLARLGEAGLQLGIAAPTRGRVFASEAARAVGPKSTMFGAAKDILGYGAYPIRAAMARRRLTEPTPPTGVNVMYGAAPAVGRVISGDENK